jgi:hypothetical protein
VDEVDGTDAVECQCFIFAFSDTGDFQSSLYFLHVRIPDFVTETCRMCQQLRTIMGRLQREVGRKMTALGLAVQEALGNTLSQAQRLISQTASRKTPGKQGKLYN